MLQNLENALPAQQFAGPHGSGGYCAQLSTLMPDAAWRRFSDSGLTAVSWLVVVRQGTTAACC